MMRKFITTVLRSILRKFDQDTPVIEPLKESKIEIEVKEGQKITDISSPEKEKNKPSRRSLLALKKLKRET